MFQELDSEFTEPLIAARLFLAELDTWYGEAAKQEDYKVLAILDEVKAIALEYTMDLEDFE